MVVPFHDTMPSFMNFRGDLDLQEFKNLVSQCLWPSHDAEVFEIHSRFLHGTLTCIQGHIYDFSTHFGALEHVLADQI